MRISSAISINIKKLKHRTSKALFLIIPIIILVSLSLIIASQAKNIENAMDKGIFKEIQSQNTVLQIERQQQQFDFGARMQIQTATESSYTQADVNKIKAISNVVDAAVNYTLPISQVTSSNLFNGKTVTLNNISVLNENMAGLYTTRNFTYTEGQPIPIILNANQFIETYEDWGGKTSISIDFQKIVRNTQSEGTPPDPSQIENQTPVKTKAIAFDKKDLIGKEFDITFGGFTSLPDYKMSRSEGTTTFTKLTAAEIKAQEKSRSDAISKYWNYKKLATGITYRFIVVGITDTNDRTAYIPSTFADKVMKDYVTRQLATRNSNTVATSELNNIYRGLLYDGTELSQSQRGGPGIRFFAGGFNKREGFRAAEMEQSSTYEIPGLVIQTAEGNTNSISGVYTKPDVFSRVLRTGDTISIKINNIVNRKQVVEDLNTAGYAYQDTNKLDVFSNIQNTLNQVSTGVIIGFIALTIAVIILTMSKFVSEGTKEIGIFRAVGFTKGNILLIFLLQAIIYTAVGYAIGIGIGFAGNLLASQFTSGWFANFAANTIKQTFNVTGSIDYTVFRNLDLHSIGLLSLILLGITVIISFIPAYKASTISPVEAIKSE